MHKPHEIPKNLIERITCQGGLSESGKPLFRIIWAPDVTEVRGQRWIDRDASGNVIREVVEYRKVEKYFFDRWVFEMWTPCMVSEDDWNYENTEMFDGIPFLKLPYPREGEYEMVKVLETPGGHFVPLTSTICDVLVMTAMQNRHVPVARRLELARERRENQDIQKDITAIEILKEQLGPMKGNPWVSVLANS